MHQPITVLSSMATRQVLTELAAEFEASTGQRVALESVGGVDAAKRVAAGERYDVVLLAADAIDKLLAAGHLLSRHLQGGHPQGGHPQGGHPQGGDASAGGRVDLLRSPVSVAVQAGAPRPDISNEAALRQAVEAAPTLSFSTGPSGNYLAGLFQRWGLTEVLAPRLVVPPPGMPVATLLANGKVALGFQQLSELMNQPGVDVLGNLPEPVQYITTFSAALGLACTDTAAARHLLNFITAPSAAATVRRHGMQAV